MRKKSEQRSDQDRDASAEKAVLVLVLAAGSVLVATLVISLIR